MKSDWVNRWKREGCNRGHYGQGEYEQIKGRIWDILLGVFCLGEGIREQPEKQNILGFDITNLVWKTEGKHKIHTYAQNINRYGK
jgi:hypothetical protein